MRRLLIGLVALAGCSNISPNSSAGIEQADTGIQVQTVCFTVHNPGDPIAVPVTGSLFMSDDYNTRRPAILLSHGALTIRQFWDGLDNGPAVVGSVARTLALAGYAVFTYDLVGHGQSPYNRGPGSGFSLSTFGYVSMLHEIVSQIHGGTFTVTTGACPSGVAPVAPAGQSAGFSKIVLGGHSLGGLIGTNYITHFNDVSALFNLGVNHQSTPTTKNYASSQLMQIAGPQLAAGNDYLYGFRPGDNGISSDCLFQLFYQPGASPTVYNTQCSNQYIRKSPAGILFTLGPLGQDTVANASAVNVPMLLTFGDNDVTSPGPGDPYGDDDLRDPEIAFWKNACTNPGCNVQSFVQLASGHGQPFHFSSPTLYWKIVSFLYGNGLKPGDN